MMLIAIDHGNKQVKTVHRTFTSGLTDSATRPAFGEDVLQYQGRYYALSDQRIPYMRDKTEDGKFFLLTLFGIAYEIEAARCYTKDDILDVQLAVGLPPAHFGAQAERFQDYFLGRDILEFSFRDKPFSIYISETVCFPQAYAAAIPMLNRLLEVPKAYVIDIGGFTADYLLLHKGKGELSVCDSLENGVILLYNQIRSKVNATYGLPLEEADIDALLQGGGCCLSRRGRPGCHCRGPGIYYRSIWQAAGAGDRPARCQSHLCGWRLHPAAQANRGFRQSGGRAIR